jgi:2,4-dienoyl-CoA reductase-like NADH-dependent reductase (Old Yellow Enzyme family)/thioredoxin reductase
MIWMKSFSAEEECNMLQRSAGSSVFPRLFQPGVIGRMEIKNRLFRAPTTTSSSTKDGWATDRLIHHYRKVAQGGVGLIIVENSYIDDIAAKQSPTQLSMSETLGRGSLGILVSIIRAAGAKVGIQLGHAGAQKSFGLQKSPSGVPIIIPWDEVPPPSVSPPEKLLTEEIKILVESYADATLRAKQIGFDMVEILGCHGYLISEFLSPQTNKRNDFYGGNLENRMRFLLEVVEKQRQKVGPDYPLCVRLSCTDYLEGGITVEDTITVAKALEDAGIDVLHVSGGVHNTMHQEVAPMYMPLANHIWATEKIKKALKIPVVASGSITTPELAEKILQEGKADFISLCRPLMADPDFPEKAREGRPEDIAPCIRCGDGCITRGFKAGRLDCTVNAALCREEEFKIAPVARPKRVAVVGGGPGGMEAARVAALRGHKVTLYEKRKLGGALLEASVPEFKADLRKLINYLSTQMKKLGVKIVNQEATSETIKMENFDAVVLATGATPLTPDVPGKNKPHVIQALDVFRGVETGNSVIVVGGGMIGRDAALFLAEQGKKVTITTRGKSISRDMNISERLGYLERLSKQKMEMRTGTQLEEVTDTGVLMRDKDGKRIELKADTVVLAAGLGADRKLFVELSQVPNLDLYAIGDCDEPRMIYEAMHEGFETAFELP